jgi:hypothetical protein
MVDSGGKGIYQATLIASASTSHPGSTVHWAVYVGATRCSNISAEQVLLSTDIATVAASGLLQLNALDKVTMQVTSDFTGDKIQVNHASLTLVRVEAQ